MISLRLSLRSVEAPKLLLYDLGSLQLRISSPNVLKHRSTNYRTSAASLVSRSSYSSPTLVAHLSTWIYDSIPI